MVYCQRASLKVYKGKNRVDFLKNETVQKIMANLQYVSPTHFCSAIAGRLASVRKEEVKNFLIRRFIELYAVDLSDAEIENPDQFVDFNDFFTRALKVDARPIDHAIEAIVSPVDGKVSQRGIMDGQTLIQAKGKAFDLLRLLGGKREWADLFTGGSFATLYLAPQNYHRVHMPISGLLEQMLYVPGRLFSVNPLSVDHIPQLYSGNERVICLFQTQLGPVAIILVGAMIVGSIEMSWHGGVRPTAGEKQLQTWDYRARQIQLNKGAELGRFLLGSTVILLFPKGAIQWQESLLPDSELRMGRRIGTIQSVFSQL